MSSRDPTAAERALARLGEMARLRGAALVGPGGEVLAASGEPALWGEAALRFLDVADAAGGRPVDHVHVATESGEVFAVRERDLALVAVTPRFPLASLMLSDMRSVIRGLEPAPLPAPG